MGEKVSHGTSLAINCTADYEAVSWEPVRCNNGSWSYGPRCVPARCKQIPSPPTNGMIVVADTNHGATGLYQCKGGNIVNIIEQPLLILNIDTDHPEWLLPTVNA